MWSDNETDIDLLDFSHLISVTLSVILNKDLIPATIGIFGDWGSGKSCLMKMLRFKLEEGKKKGIFCISFNGWLFEGYEDAKTALLSVILQEIKNRRKLTVKTKEKLQELSKKIDWMRVALMIGKYPLAYVAGGMQGISLAAGFDVVQIAQKIEQEFQGISAEDVEKIFKEKQKGEDETSISIRNFHDEFADLLKSSGIETLVVFIDDLDRCSPDTIIGTLEAIKLFLFTPQTVFIIGADENLVQYAVRRRFPEYPGDRTAVGRDYLEKLIQFPIRIPPLGEVELETYINLLYVSHHVQDPIIFDQIRKATINRKPEQLFETNFNINNVREILGKISTELNEDLALARYLAPVLTRGLSGNPRQTKRFLNTLIMRNEMAKSRRVELKIQVLAKLMLLEYFHPENFRQLARLQIEQNGHPKELLLLEQAGLSKLGIEPTPDPNVASSVNEKDKVSKADHNDKSASLNKKVVDSESPLTKIDGTLQVWIDDEQVINWLASEPRLSECDLRPYFFFSREKIGLLSARSQRLSPLAQDLLAKFTHASKAVRLQAQKQASGISEGDALAIFNEIANRIRQQEKVQNQDLDGIILLVNAKPDLKGQLITLFGELAESALTAAVIPNLLSATKETKFSEAALGLIRRWSNSTINKGLASIAEKQLQQKSN